MQVSYLCFLFFLTLQNFPKESQQEEQTQDVQAAGMCTQETSPECQYDAKTKPELVSINYGTVSMQALSNIEKAERKYTPCTSHEPHDPKCECHQKVWQKDLEVFKVKGISREQIQDAAQYGTAYKILNHKLYRDQNCFFPSRCEGIEYFLLTLLPSLPDMDFVINTRDYPQIRTTFTKNLTPVLSFSKSSDFSDIMYPAWTFWAGGPAIKLFPTGLGRWDLQREKISKAAEEYPWDLKLPKAFFRGSRTSHQRDSLIYLSRSHPELVDAAYTKNQAWKSPKDTLGAEPAEEVSLEHHCRYKYLFNFRGVAASFRLKHLFLCKSLVFHAGNEWLEFFYPALKPWKHYVPLDANPSIDDISDILEFFKRHDNLAKEIALAGYEFIWNHLRMDDVECYWKDLLTSYSKLIKFPIEENKTMTIIREKAKKNQRTIDDL